MINLYSHQQQALKDTENFNHVAYYHVPIKGYEGLYEIDEFGNVYSVIQNNSRRKGIIKPFINSSGYLRINLYDNGGKSKKHYIHRLVANAFISNPDHLKIVNHKDCNKLNNHYSNLEWCTQSQNVNHSYENGRQKSTRVLIDGELFYSLRKASRFLGHCDNYLSLKIKENGNRFEISGHLIEVVI